MRKTKKKSLWRDIKQAAQRTSNRVMKAAKRDADLFERELAWRKKQFLKNLKKAKSI